MIDTFFKSISGYKTYAIVGATLGWAIYGMSMHLLSIQMGSLLVVNALLAGGFRSAFAKEAGTVATLIAEYLANKQSIDVKTEANKVVQQILSDAITKLAEPKTE